MALVGLGFEIAVPVVLCSYLGYRADRWLDTGPWLLVTGALLGITLGFYGFFRRVSPGTRGRSGG
jgi:F0F1-type ATP synthase assembly protein I